MSSSHHALPGALKSQSQTFHPPCRLTTARSGEIITRLGSGQIMSMPSLPFQSPRDPKLPLPELRRSSANNCGVDGPKEPKDGTLAQPGPSHAKIQGRGLAFSNGRGMWRHQANCRNTALFWRERR